MKLIRVLIKISDNFNESKSKFFSFHAVQNIKKWRQNSRYLDQSITITVNCEIKLQ